MFARFFAVAFALLLAGCARGPDMNLSPNSAPEVKPLTWADVDHHSKEWMDYDLKRLNAFMDGKVEGADATPPTGARCIELAQKKVNPFTPYGAGELPLPYHMLFFQMRDCGLGPFHLSDDELLRFYMASRKGVPIPTGDPRKGTAPAKKASADEAKAALAYVFR